MIAIPWFVISTTQSPALTGIVAAAQMGPYVIAKAMAGPLVDRLGPRRVVTIAELLSGAVVLTIPILHLLDLLSIVALAVIVAVLGTVTGPADGGKSSMIPTVADDARVPLERVTGLFGSIERLASTVGAALAGAIVALVGAPGSLWITSTTFLIAASIVAATAQRKKPAVVEEPYLIQLRSGLYFIWRDRLLRSIYAMTATTNLLDAAAFSVLLPVWAHSTGYGPEAIGLATGTLSATSMTSSLIAAAVGHRMPRRLTYLIAFMLTGLPRFAILTMDVDLWTVVVVFAVSGAASGFLNPILGAVIFERIPRPMVGRVNSMGSALAWSGMPFGGLLGGGLIAVLGLSPAILLCGIAYFIVTILPGLQKEWAEMERTTPGKPR